MKTLKKKIKNKMVKVNTIPKSKVKSTGEEVYTFVVEIRDGTQILKKFCPCCEQYKEYSGFSKNKALREGLQLYCKLCIKKNQIARAKKLTDKLVSAPAEETHNSEVESLVPLDQIDSFSLLSSRMSLADEVHQLRLKEVTLVSIISALAARSGGMLELSKGELEAAEECLFRMGETHCLINSRGATTGRISATSPNKSNVPQHV